MTALGLPHDGWGHLFSLGLKLCMTGRLRQHCLPALGQQHNPGQCHKSETGVVGHVLGTNVVYCQDPKSQGQQLPYQLGGRVVHSHVASYTFDV